MRAVCESSLRRRHRKLACGSGEAARAMGQQGRRYAVEHRAYGVIADTVEKQLLSVVESGS